MRRGFRNAWKYDGFPRTAEIASIDGKEIPLEELPGTFLEREYERKFPSYEAPATDNAANLARFHKLSGKSHKVTKELTEVSTTRRDETYARLAKKTKGNKWFDDNA